jgi:hypothetical protein
MAGRDLLADDFGSTAGRDLLADDGPAPAQTREIPVFDPATGASTGFTEQAPTGPSKKTVEFEKRAGPFGYAKEFSKGVGGAIAGMPAELTVNLPSNLVPIAGLVPKAAGFVLNKTGKISDENYKVRGERLQKKLDEAQKKSRVGYGAPEAEKFFFGSTKPGSVEAGMRASGQAAGALVGPSEVLGIARGISKIPSLLRGGKEFVTGSRSAQELGDALASARARGDELIAKATTAAEKEQAIAAKNRFISEAAISREEKRLAGVSTETEQLADLARQEVKLPKPEGGAELAAGKDVNSDLRKIAADRLAKAEKVQEEVGGGAFEQYKRTAAEKQKTEPFGVSSEGQSLKTELDEIVSGGKGALKQYGQAVQDLAKRVRSELFGRAASEISEADVLAKAAQNPNRSMSQPAKMALARKELEAAEGSGRKPVDFKVVDDLIRELRQKQSAKAAEGFTQVERERLGSAANKVEEALKNWIGEANYPREAYAASSEKVNTFRTKLGEALTATEEVQYVTGKTPPTTKTSRLADIVFDGKENTQLAKQLLGEREVHWIGERHAINELAGKDAKAVVEWLGNKKNTFIDEIPGLRQKLEKYGASLARRKGDAETVKLLQKQYGEARTTARGVEETATKELEKLKGTLDDLRIKIADADPKTLRNEWTKTGGLRKALEDTGRFTPQQLDSLAQEIIRLGEVANKAERQQKYRDFAMKVGKYVGLPYLGFEAGKTFLRD